MSTAEIGSPWLEIRDLRVRYDAADGPVHAVVGVDLTVARGEVLGVVGESGCGKSSLARAVVGLLPGNAAVTGGRVRVGAHDLSAASPARWRELRRTELAYMPQHSAAALDPLRRVGRQFADVLRAANGRVSADEVHRVSSELLEAAGLRDVPRVLRAYPHELSGGMAQRIALCVALARRPSVLVADEPTSGLDLTVLRKVMEMLRQRCRSEGMAVVMVTHNIGAVAQYCNRVAVMYGGAVVESGPVSSVLGDPRHPYTRALLGALPRRGEPLALLPGVARVSRDGAPGCPFRHRCPVGAADPGLGEGCANEPTTLRMVADDHAVAGLCAHGDALEREAS
ncbi:ABC transporter ATP-binding protein [Pseudonocardia sp. NPDC049635]|uniref:ABC transporter ATP-binding protein n=1 Tax=Pseudonocardia sp. NPDC049635 TaxID=3155506 RepID=UPI0033FEE0F7